MTVLAERDSIFQAIKEIPLSKALTKRFLNERPYLIRSRWSIPFQAQLAHIFIEGSNRSHNYNYRVMCQLKK
jgi:hypothetical protein